VNGRRGGRGVAALVLPNCLVIALFLLLPSVEMIAVSFHRHSTTAVTGEGFTLANYARLADWFYLDIIWRTVRLAFVATLIATVLAYPVAYVMARSRRAWRITLSCLVMVPLMTSVVVKTFGWYILLGRDGFIVTLLDHLGIGARTLIGNDVAVLVGLSEFSLPFMIFSLLAAIEQIPVSLEEAASNLGGRGRAVFFKVIVPLSRAGLLSGALLCFGVSSSAYVVPAIMGGPSARMVAQQIFDDVLVAFNWPGAAALSIVLLLLLGTVIYAAIALGQRRAA
jgi:ABC-type spermidine/putrescine transport system permease subunit I